MKKQLIDVVFASDKRKNVLLLLKDGPEKMEDLLNSLETSRQALLPQIRILEEHNLVADSNDVYELTTIGKLVVEEMVPLLEKVKVFDNNIEFWGTHNLKSIPRHLLERIGEIGDCGVVEPGFASMFEINKNFVEQALSSDEICLVTSFMHPSYPSLLARFLEKGSKVAMIISEGLFRKLKEEWYEEFSSFVDSENVKFYVYRDDLILTSLAIADNCFILRLLLKDKEFSNTQLACSSPAAHRWSRDLFDYYLQDSVPVTRI
jgi:predicted transcriptional regulator